MKSTCQHCRDGWFEPKSDGPFFGQDVHCVNGVLIDIDEYMEGHQPDLAYPVAPCHPAWDRQQRGEEFENDCQERLATGRTGAGEAA